MPLLFVSKPAEAGEKQGYTLSFNSFTMELVEIIDDRPFCSVNKTGARLNTKYIPEYEDLQSDIQIGGNPQED